jgi:hypothetical protein
MFTVFVDKVSIILMGKLRAKMIKTRTSEGMMMFLSDIFLK